MKLEIEVPDDFEPTMIAVGCKPEYKLSPIKFFPHCDSGDIEYLNEFRGLLLESNMKVLRYSLKYWREEKIIERTG